MILMLESQRFGTNTHTSNEIHYVSREIKTDGAR